jgi:hypothetical protein
LDTRKKIRPAADAAVLRREAAGQNKTVRAVAGNFDPLLIEHARMLGDFARPEAILVAVVAPSENPLLTVRARAELVAALAAVDCVFAADGGDVEAILADLAPEAVLRCEDGDKRRTAELIAHVHSRY